jgi:hypothetical protein
MVDVTTQNMLTYLCFWCIFLYSYVLRLQTKNWEEAVWLPLVDKITKEYSKAACLVACEFLYVNSEGNDRNEPIFFKWCPDSGVPLKAKMLIGSSFQSTKKKLDVQGTTPEVSQTADLELNRFADQAKLKGWVSKK